MSMNKEAMTVDELLDAIRAEKQALIKAGKLKVEKPLPPIKAEEIPFAIPNTWKWVRLGEIGETRIGLTYNPTDIAGNGTPVLRANNIQNGKMIYDDLVYVKRPVPRAKICDKGDILICVRNGSARLVGKTAVVDQEGMSFGAFMSIFRSQFNPYLIYFFASHYFRGAFISDVNTTTINQITQSMLRNVLIPLPPLEVQKAIAERLEKRLADVDAMEAQFRTIAESAKQAFKSTLVETFENLDAPKVKLGDVCIEARERVACESLTHETFITTDNMIKEFGGVKSAETIPSTGSVTAYRGGDILLSNIRPYLRKLWIAERDGGCSNDVVVFRVTGCLTSYLYWVLSQDLFYTYVMLNPSGTKMPRGRRDWIKRFQFPLPTLEVQKAIAERLTVLQKRCEETERVAREGMEWCKTLRKALLEEAFRNE